MRIKFKKGKQREFIKKVMENSNCPSLKELENRMVGISYSSLKNYFSKRRKLPQSLFLDLCRISNFEPNNFEFVLLDENWGRSKGGRKSRR